MEGKKDKKCDVKRMNNLNKHSRGNPPSNFKASVEIRRDTQSNDRSRGNPMSNYKTPC